MFVNLPRLKVYLLKTTITTLNSCKNLIYNLTLLQKNFDLR